MGDILSKGIAGPSLDELKSMLGEQEYAAVMKTINAVIEKNKREVSEIESKALEDARKRQKEVRPYRTLCCRRLTAVAAERLLEPSA